jgi:hypothetical protein
LLRALALAALSALLARSAFPARLLFGTWLLRDARLFRAIARLLTPTLAAAAATPAAALTGRLAFTPCRRD